ncbi:MAG: arylsulfatase, partial [Akkermansiaceae bacterium]
EIIDAPLPSDRSYDGVSILPILKGENINRPDEEPFYYYNCENLQAVRMGPWKLHLPRTKNQVPFWDKNKVFFSIQSPVLYNLKTDHAESIDVAEANPEVVQQLLSFAQSTRQSLGEFMQRGSAQRPTGTLFPEVPVISHEKDWGTLDPATAKAMAKERSQRHPDLKQPRRKKK